MLSVIIIIFIQVPLFMKGVINRPATYIQNTIQVCFIFIQDNCNVCVFSVASELYAQPLSLRDDKLVEDNPALSRVIISIPRPFYNLVDFLHCYIA